MSWQFSWDTTVITWPINPTKATMKFTTIRKTVPVPGDYAILISTGKQPKVLTIEGILYEPGKTAAQLETDYINPMLDRLHKEVTISAPDTRYDGTWILTAFTYSEAGGAINQFRYKLEFYMGSSHIVL